ncbi:MAG TPA: redoxin domain-containing protein [Bryobacteraceae bacterium]|nr:redoxin domain-containing protein [Bryobacteraceae bacterium]
MKFPHYRGVIISFFVGLLQAADPSAAEICQKVSETYSKLSACQMTATVETEVVVRGGSASGSTTLSLAFIKPDKLCLTRKEADRELLVVGDGETTWRYLPKTRQYTKESAAATTGDEDEPAAKPDTADPVVAAQNQLVNRYVGLRRYAPIAVLVREDRLKFEGNKVDCAVVHVMLPQGLEEFWVDKSSFLVLRQVSQAKSGATAAKVTLNLKQADIANPPDGSLFTFAPPERSTEVQALNIPGERPNLAGRPAMDFTLKNLNGEKVTLSDLRGQVVLIDFWASWCGPCRHELPTIEKLHREYENKGLVVLGINDEDSGLAKKFLVKNEYTIPVLMDAKKEVAKAYGTRAIPTVVVVDKNGVIRAHFVGGRSEEQLRLALKSAGL